MSIDFHDLNVDRKNPIGWSGFHLEFAGRFGRFNPADPSHSVGSGSQRLNLYAYAADDPINLADPQGLNPNGPPFASEEEEGLGFVLGGGPNCSIDGISTDCRYVSNLTNVSIFLQAVQLYFADTGAIPVPSSAYNPLDVSNPPLIFAGGAIYIPLGDGTDRASYDGT